MDRVINIAIGAFVILLTGIVGSIVLTVFDSSWVMWLPLLAAVLLVTMYLLFESGRQVKTFDFVNGAVNDQNQVVTVVTREDIDQMLREGDEFIASYEQFLSTLAKKKKLSRVDTV